MNTKTHWRRTVADEIRDIRRELFEIIKNEAQFPQKADTYKGQIETAKHRVRQTQIVANQLRVTDRLEDQARSMVIVA